MNLEEFLAKLDWEGGIGGLVSYGLSPDEAPEQVREVYRHAYAAIEAFEQTLDELEGKKA